MTLNAPPPPRKFPRWVLMPVGVSIVSVVFFVAVRQVLSPPDSKAPVAFSDFVDEVHAGRVDEIKIHDREFTFRTHDSSGRSIVKEAVGPIPDPALIASLKPDDPKTPPPKIYVDP